jgi:hypothetical protein
MWSNYVWVILMAYHTVDWRFNTSRTGNWKTSSLRLPNLKTVVSHFSVNPLRFRMSPSIPEPRESFGSELEACRSAPSAFLLGTRHEWHCTLSVGLTSYIRQGLGYDMVNYSSDAYFGGQVVGVGHSILIGYGAGGYAPQAGMALYNGYKCAISLAAQWSILLYFHELWQLMMTSQTCLRTLRLVPGTNGTVRLS